MILRRLLLTLLVALMPKYMPDHIQASTAAPAPYLYYFSDKLHEFIIERADGTDTHVLGDGLMPHANRVRGPGWSPSGKWFAWTGIQQNTEDDSSNILWEHHFIVSADNTQRLNLLDDIPANANMVWAPDRDLLLVTSQDETVSADNSVIHNFAALINLENRTRLVLEDKTYPGELSGEDFTGFWIGQQFVLENPNYSQSPSDTFWIGDETGIHKQISLPHVISQHIESDVYDDSAGIYQTFQSFSASGEVAYRTENNLVVENLLTGQMTNLPVVVGLYNNVTIQWSPDGSHGILTDGHDTWLVSPGTAQLTNEAVPPNPSTQSSNALQQIWSPNSQHALILSGDTLYHLNVVTAQLDKVPIEGQSINWSWRSDTQAFIYACPAYEAPQAPALLVDFAAGTTQNIFVPDLSTEIPQLKLSPDTLHLLMIGEGSNLYQLQPYSEQQLRPPAGAWRSDPGGDMLWNKDSQWALTFKRGFFGQHYLGVIRADGHYQRDLSFIYDPVSSISLNWLPPQVNPANLSPALSRPLFVQPKQVLTGQDWSFGLIWSPDGKRLLSENGDEPTSVQLWNIASRKGVPIVLKPDDTHGLGWTQNEKGEFVPALTTATQAQGSWSGLYPLAYSPNGTQVIISGGKDNFPPGVYDTKSQNLIYRLDVFKGDIYSASYSPDGRLLAVASPFASAYIWDTTTWNIVATLPEVATSVAFSPDGKQIAAGTSWNVNLYDVRDLITATLCTQQNACF